MGSPLFVRGVQNTSSHCDLMLFQIFSFRHMQFAVNQVSPSSPRLAHSAIITVAQLVPSTALVAHAVRFESSKPLGSRLEPDAIIPIAVSPEYGSCEVKRSSGPRQLSPLRVDSLWLRRVAPCARGF